MIKRADIQVVVIDFRPVTDFLRRWVRQWPGWVYASDICSNTFRGLDLLALWRNQVCEWFLKKNKRPWLWMLDNDVVPRRSMYEVLNAETNVAAARFFSRKGAEGHSQDGHISMASLFVSRRALELIERPWFKFSFNKEHTRLVQCECDWFSQQASKAGFSPVKIGRVGHVFEAAFSCDKEDGLEIEFLHRLKDVPWIEEKGNG